MAKGDQMQFRIVSADKTAFVKKCNSIDRDYSDLLREFVTAFNEGRLRITPTDEQKNLNKELYNA